jgi:hypothetical protein
LTRGRVNRVGSTQARLSDEWKLALGVDTRGEEEEEDMWVLLK